MFFIQIILCFANFSDKNKNTLSNFPMLTAKSANIGKDVLKNVCGL